MRDGALGAVSCRVQISANPRLVSRRAVMARWQPGTAERLQRAALELFAEHGYDNTTVSQIAARAGTTRSTFFRHYGDKRETVFAGQEHLARRYGEAVAAAPADERPPQAIVTALDAISSLTFTDAARQLAAMRMAVVRATPELRERELLKGAAIIDAVAKGFSARGLDERAAAVAAQIGLLVFTATVEVWADLDVDEDTPTVIHRMASEFGDALAEIV